MATEPHLQLVLSPYQNAFFHELADVIVHELREAGVAADIVTPATAVLDSSSVFVLLPPHEYVALEGDVWLHDEALLGRTIALLAEQPTQAHFEQNAGIARRVAAAFDFNATAVRAYQRYGVEARHLPFGYTSRWDRFDHAVNPSLDVVYMGSDEPRRGRLLATCAPVLSQRRARLVVSDNLAPNRGTSATFIGGDEKRRLLADSRVLLNIHRSDEPYFEWLRFIEAFHCGVPVLSEPSLATAPFVAGTHFISAAPGALPYVLDDILDDTDRLQQVRVAAYEELRRHPFSRSLEQLVAVARGLLDRPVPHTLPPFTRSAPHPHPYDTLLTLDADSSESIMRQQLRELRLEMQAVRRQLAAIQRTVLDPTANDGPPSSVVAESIAHQLATEAPTVSVIMALYNHADFVGAALDSAIAAADDLPYELVICDDGSTDESRQTVTDWIHAHPWVRARLIGHRVNQGLPYARNTAVAAATGEFVFVLDADNEIFPGAFPALVRPLQADSAASFAYGMLEAFTQDGPVATMGMWPWQPKRLRNGNYIDAMAMIRASALHALEGYTTDRRLYGWEDYDLWCRMAEAGRHGRQVPNFVARYRRSPTSMVALSNVSQVPAFAALAERCPQLMAGRLDHVEVGSFTEPTDRTASGAPSTNGASQ